MAPKRPSPPPAEDPPADSSSESDESGEESSDEEVTPAPPPPPAVAQTQKPKQDKKPSSSSVDLPRTTVEAKSTKVAQTKPQSSSDDEESDSGSESDCSPPAQKLITDLNVKPISSKPAVVVDPPSTKEKPKSVLKPTVTALAAVTTRKITIKRPVETSKDGNDPKRAKKKDLEAADPVTPEKKSKEKDGEAADPVESERKPLFQRLWSEEDEIVILKGIIDFISERGIDPAANVEAFYDFINKSLVSGGTRAQLIDKIRRLKKKYRNHASKVKDGKDKIFSNPHEQLSYDLSKNIWGGCGSVNGGSVDQLKSNGKAKVVPKSENALPQSVTKEFVTSIRVPNEGSTKKDVSNESMLLHQGVGFAGLDESFMRRGLGLIDSVKKTELEEKWKNLLVAETEVFLMRNNLVREQTMLVLDAYKKQ